MNRWRRIVPVLLACLWAGLFVSGCGKSIFEKGKEGALRTLVDTRLEQGRYVVFWNGKDDQGQILPAGSYRIRMLAEEYDAELDMTGLDGGKESSADSSAYIPGNPFHFSLEQNFPNPFTMKNGTNIPFAVPYATHVQLTIRNKS